VSREALNGYNITRKKRSKLQTRYIALMAHLTGNVHKKRRGSQSNFFEKAEE